MVITATFKYRAFSYRKKKSHIERTAAGRTDRRDERHVCRERSPSGLQTHHVLLDDSLGKDHTRRRDRAQGGWRVTCQARRRLHHQPQPIRLPKTQRRKWCTADVTLFLIIQLLIIKFSNTLQCVRDFTHIDLFI